jgi:hypothetical protein
MALAHQAQERAAGATGLLARAGTLLAAGNAIAAAALARQAQAVDPRLREVERLLLARSRPEPPDVIFDRATALVAAGFAATPILDSLLRAAAQSGRADVVRRMTHGLLHCERLHGPDDPDLVPLAVELTDELRYYAAPSDRAIRNGGRRTDLECGKGPPFVRRMFERLRKPVERYLATLARLAEADPGHPFLTSRPHRYRLVGWSVISGAETYHLAHIHPESWCNGVYYVEVPAIVAEPSRRSGWLRVGPPENAAGEFAAWDECWIQPDPGLLILMPSYFYHRSTPLGVDQRRICVAFEIQPEFSPG